MKTGKPKVWSYVVDCPHCGHGNLTNPETHGWSFLCDQEAPRTAECDECEIVSEMPEFGSWGKILIAKPEGES